MNQKKYWILTSLATFILLPVWLNYSIYLLTTPIIAHVLFNYDGWYWSFLGGFLFLSLPYAIYLYGKDVPLPNSSLSRYGPFLAPVLFHFIVWLMVALVYDGKFPEGIPHFLYVFTYFFPFVHFLGFAGTFHFAPAASLIVCLYFMACFALGTWRGKCFTTQEDRKTLFVLAAFVAFAAIAIALRFVQH